MIVDFQEELWRRERAKQTEAVWAVIEGFVLEVPEEGILPSDIYWLIDALLTAADVRRDLVVEHIEATIRE